MEKDDNMTTKNRNENDSDHLFYVAVVSLGLGFASLFGLFVVTVSGIVAPLLLALLSTGLGVGMLLGLGLLMVLSGEFWSSSIQ